MKKDRRTVRPHRGHATIRGLQPAGKIVKSSANGFIRARCKMLVRVDLVEICRNFFASRKIEIPDSVLLSDANRDL